jgi:DNA-binding PadR family transcriptional regulator
MPKPWKPTLRQQRVLLALLSGAPNLYGLTLCRVSQTGSKTVYPLLARMESCGWVTNVPPGPLAESPARHCYTLTPEGRKAALGFLKLED